MNEQQTGASPEQRFAHRLSSSDRQFLHSVEDCTLSAAEFKHRAHLKIAYAYLAELDMEGARAAVKQAIRRFLRQNGVDESKYHETMTQAWLLAVHYFMARSGTTGCADEFIDKSPALTDPRVMLTHYSREVLFSDVARSRFVEPDLEPIPTQVRPTQAGPTQAGG